MKKFTLAALAVVALGTVANAQVRWNPEGSWTADNGETTLPVSEDGKYVINKLGKLENGNWRKDIRYAADCKLIEDEPYLVFWITTEGCSWNLNDCKFEFMIQRKLSDGLNEEGAVKWGGNTQSTDEKYPSFRGDKLKLFDEYGATSYKILGSSIKDGDTEVYTEDVYVIDLNNVQGTDEDRTPGLLFSAGDVDMPNYNSFVDIVPADETTGLGGVQQRSWMGFVMIAKPETVTVDEPAFLIRYTGTVESEDDALIVCENYANGEGGMEVREGEEPEDPSTPEAVGTVADENILVMLNGNNVIANGAALEAYTVDGKLVKSGNNSLELNNGIYIVKAVRNGKATTVKAVVR